MSAAEDLRDLAKNQRSYDFAHARELVMMAMHRAGRLMPEDTPRGLRVAELFSALVQELVREEQGIPWVER